VYPLRLACNGAMGWRSGYCTVLDQAEVSPDSKPSSKTGTENLWPWMLVSLVSVPDDPMLDQATTELP